MNNFNFCAPTSIHFGRGVECEVGPTLRDLGAKRVLLHFGGGSARRSGLLDRIAQSLTEAGLSFVELGGVSPNPKLSFVHQGIELCKREGIDFILAVGGGSVIDSAKNIGVGLVTGRDPWDFAMSGESPRPDQVFPVAVVLTIAAAGSEMSSSSVLTNDLETPWRKMSIGSETIRPKAAFLNPENTFTVSKWQTGCGIVDTMMHTLERYFTGDKDCDLTDRISEGLLIAVRDAGRRAIANPTDYEARATLMWASSVSHNDITGCGKNRKFPVHKLEHPVSALHDNVSHGAGLAVLFPAWSRWIMQHDLMKFAQLAVRVWGCEMDFDHPERTAEAGIDAMTAYFHEIGMPTTFAELGLSEADFDDIINLATNGGKDAIPSYVDLYSEQIREIFMLAK